MNDSVLLSTVAFGGVLIGWSLDKLVLWFRGRGAR